MKKFKAIVPALAMLLVSAVLLGTSTFAWFSMNNEVSVSGMQITAKSDQHYLIIGSENNLAKLQDKTTGNQTTIELKKTDSTDPLSATVKPVQPKAGAITNATTAATPGSWEWYVGTSKTDGTAKPNPEGGATTPNAVTDLKEYTLHTTVYITVAKDTPEAKNLILEEATFAKVGAGKTLEGFGGVVVATNDAADRFDSDNALKARSDAGKPILAATVNDQTVIAVEIYVYVYGANANITTENAFDLATLSLKLKFSVAA